jgi:hypothetical protein
MFVLPRFKIAWFIGLGLGLTFLGTTTLAMADDLSTVPPAEDHEKELLTKEQKLLLLNAVAMAAITGYGLLKWDYGKENFNVTNEGWFEYDTKDGGADKLGHFWSSYTATRLFSYLLRQWGYSDREAFTYAALSGMGIQTYMEIADGFSGHGFSYEDLISDLVGVSMGYLWERYPSLSNKIDFRLEYTPEFNNDDTSVFTNYEQQRYFIVFKADGFDFIKNPYLRYAEFLVGYSAEGYEDFSRRRPDERKRTVSFGLGFSVTRLLQNYVDTTVLDYIQIPYTYLRFDLGLD